VAEGCSVKNKHGINFASETKYLKRAKKIIKNKFNIEMKYYPATSNKSPCIQKSNRALNIIFKELTNDLSWIIQLSKTKLKHFIYGYWQGDGYHNSKYKKDKIISFDTINEELAYDIMVMLSRFGIVAGKRKYDYTKKKMKFKPTKPINYITATGMKELNILKWDKNKDLQKIKNIIKKDLVLVNIREINKFNYMGNVYDFSVPKTQNFIAGDLIVAHNTREEVDMKEESDTPMQFCFQVDQQSPPQFFDTWEQADKVAEKWWVDNQKVLKELI
jgi:intein/homing endonuclease